MLGQKTHLPPTKPQACRHSLDEGFRSELAHNGQIAKSLVRLLRMVSFLTTWQIRPTCHVIVAKEIVNGVALRGLNLFLPPVTQGSADARLGSFEK